MENKQKTEKRLITAALPYINNVPHLGHIVGSHLPADIFARYCRLKNYEVLFVGGTDEHGSTTEISASKVGLDIETFSKRLHEEHKKIYDWFDISYDNFSRTTSLTHYDLVKDFFEKISKNGYIKRNKMKVFYSEKDNRFLPDRYVKGECPKCGYKGANGDQCESCTAILDPLQLKNPKSTLSEGNIEIKESEHLFLDLKKLSPKLKKWIISKKNWRKQVTSIALSWIKEGLIERCITRDLKHGIPVPLEGFENKVFYVWFDAPIGYVSFTKEISSEWKKFWTGKVYNFLGKDNIPFHTIFWPGIIIAEGELNLPEKVIGLQYLNYEGGKFSKSQKRGVFCEKLSESKIPSDIWRAYLTQIIPETNDTEFKWKEFQERINSDLIGNFGNFVNRVFSFSKSRFDGKINNLNNLNKSGSNFVKEVGDKLKEIESLFENCEIRKTYSEILILSSIGNKFFNDSEPWKKIKENKEDAERVLFLCLDLIKKLSIILSPFLPKSSKKIWKQLNKENLNWKDLCLQEEYYKLGDIEILFSNLDDEVIEESKRITSNAPLLEDFLKIPQAVSPKSQTN